MKWPMIPLKDVAPSEASTIRFRPDDTVWQLTLDQIESQTGYIAEKRMVSAAEAGNSTFVFDEGNVLYSKLRPYLNKVVHPQGPGIATTELIPLRPRKDVLDCDYLTYYLRSNHFLSFAKQCVAGVKMPRIIMAKFWQHRIPLPPLSEQRRIVEVLDRADVLRKNRAEADTKAERILSALFYKMFGDPVTNPMGWYIQNLEDIAFTCSGGTPSRRNPEYFHGEFAWVKSGELRDTIIRVTEESITQAGLENSSAKLVVSGTILVAMYGATVGKTGLLEIYAATNQAVCCISPNDEILDRWYLFFLLRLLRPLLLASREGGAQPNINQEKLKKLHIPLPPIELQRYFGKAVKCLVYLSERLNSANSKLNNVFSGLLHWAFSGDLTAKWRETHIEELLAEIEKQAKLLATNGP